MAILFIILGIVLLIVSVHIMDVWSINNLRKKFRPEVLDRKIKEQEERIQNLDNKFDEFEWEYLDLLLYFRQLINRKR